MLEELADALDELALPLLELLDAELAGLDAVEALLVPELPASLAPLDAIPASEAVAWVLEPASPGPVVCVLWVAPLLEAASAGVQVAPGYMHA